MTFIINPYRFSVADFSPSDIADLRVWYDAASLGLADGALVSTWTDLSGNGLHLTSSGGNRPIYRTNSANGLPSVEFTGTTTRLTRTGVSMSPTTGTWTVFAVVLTDTVAAGTRMIFNGDDQTNPRSSQFLRTDAANVQTVPNAQVTETAGPSITTGTWYALESVRSATHVEAFVDGVGNGPTARTLPQEDAEGFQMGMYVTGSLFWDGKIAEVIGYERDLSVIERAQVRDYLMNRYLGRSAQVYEDLGSAEVGVKGDWVGVYGGDGYYLLNPLFDGMTPAVTTSGLSTHSFGTTTDARGLENPSQGATRNLSGLFTATFGSVAVGPFSSGYSGNLHIHTTPDVNSTDRRGRYTVYTQNDHKVVNVDFAHTEGAWSHFPNIVIPTGGSLYIVVECTGGANFFISGVWLGET